MIKGQEKTLPWERTQTSLCSGNALKLHLQITGPKAWRCFFHLVLSFLFTGANLTEKIRKIKVVFTPTICKQTCQSGCCYYSCEKGDTTTLYSQGGMTMILHLASASVSTLRPPAHLLTCFPILFLLTSLLYRLGPWAAIWMGGDGFFQCLGRCLLGSLELSPSLTREGRQILPYCSLYWASNFCFHPTPGRGHACV